MTLKTVELPSQGFVNLIKNLFGQHRELIGYDRGIPIVVDAESDLMEYLRDGLERTDKVEWHYGLENGVVIVGYSCSPLPTLSAKVFADPYTNGKDLWDKVGELRLGVERERVSRRTPSFSLEITYNNGV